MFSVILSVFIGSLRPSGPYINPRPSLNPPDRFLPSPHVPSILPSFRVPCLLRPFHLP